MTNEINLIGMPKCQLDDLFSKLGEKPYRSIQLMKWIYHNAIYDFDAMSNISKNLREVLKNNFTLNLLKIVKIVKAKDETIKFVLALDSNNHIETVYIPENDRGTLCISSQVGCALECSFCATGKQGFNRNLAAHEIIAQVLIVRDYLSVQNKKITNIVFMGMGEPLLNEENVFNAIEVLVDDNAFGLSRRKVTISTAGVVPALYRFSDRLQISLAISLHSADNSVRDILVPINKKYNIDELMKACRYYINKGKQKRHILFEYVMLKDINDSVEDANKLVKLLKNIRAKVNLIPFNTFPETNYKKPSLGTINKFQNILHNNKIRITTRRTRGDDIIAACGQLRCQLDDKTKRNI